MTTTNHVWSMDEDREIIRMFVRGTPTIAIADKLGLPRAATRARVAYLRRKGIVLPKRRFVRSKKDIAELIALAKTEAAALKEMGNA